MSSRGSGTSEPNVVAPRAAARIRSVVFASRDQRAITTREVLERLLEDGHGGEFEEGIRATRVLTWVKQVFRRLRKHGWIESRTEAEWIPTAALRACLDVKLLAGRVPRRPRHPPGLVSAEPAGELPPGPEAVPLESAAPEPERPRERARVEPLPPALSSPPDPTNHAPQLASVESWPGYVETLVLSHRDAPFAIGDLVADMIRQGFGSGTPPRERLDAARKVAEEKLREMGFEGPDDGDIVAGGRGASGPTGPNGFRPARTDPPPAQIPEADEHSSATPSGPTDPTLRPRAGGRGTRAPSRAVREVDDAPASDENRAAPRAPEQRRRSPMDADLEAVLATLRQKHATASREAELYARMIEELEGMLRGSPVVVESSRGDAKRPARKRKARKVRSRAERGGMTITQAIHKVIADAGHPLTPAEIVPAAARLAGSAEISVRTSITPLAQKGALTKVEHDGRGFRYGLPEGM